MHCHTQFFKTKLFRAITLVAVLFLLLGAAGISASAQENIITLQERKDARSLSDLFDTVNHNAYMSGYENNVFKPHDNITRAEAARVFYNLLMDKKLPKISFSDVPQGKWYSNAIGTMGYLGIVGGYEDGTFRPNQNITRAEFSTMAVSIEGVKSGAVSQFSDVPTNAWYYKYVATAAERKWISGNGDGTFRPNDPITRTEAIVIINRMLGRVPPDDAQSIADTGTFYDLFTDFWGYKHVVEATTSHTYTMKGGKEKWLDYERSPVTATTGWVTSHEDRYYLNGTTKKFFRGDKTVDGVTYYFDSRTAKAFTGFRSQGGYKRYYRNGLLVDDISNANVVSGPYYIKVYKPANYLIIFAKDENGSYNIPVRSMLVSCGEGTITGTYYTPARFRWLRMIGDTYAQWCTQIQGNYLFHAVPNWTHNNFDLEVEEYNLLGHTRSLGCIRLNSEDAKWIFDNCRLGTEVYISPNETQGPLPKPEGLKIPLWHTWDPTDPTAYWKCVETGCH